MEALPYLVIYGMGFIALAGPPILFLYEGWVRKAPVMESDELIRRKFLLTRIRK